MGAITKPLTPFALDALERAMEQAQAQSPRPLHFMGMPPKVLQEFIDELRHLRRHLVALIPQEAWQDDPAAVSAIAHLRCTCGRITADAMLREAQISIEPTPPPAPTAGGTMTEGGAPCSP